MDPVLNKFTNDAVQVMISAMGFQKNETFFSHMGAEDKRTCIFEKSKCQQ